METIKNLRYVRIQGFRIMSVDKKILSICIPVYNQVDLVMNCLSKIVQSSSDKFEVIVNDDGSTDPIEYKIKEFNDSRIKYFKNKRNLGHDRNIIQSFKRASSKYVFLLRVRDFLLPEGIELLVDYLQSREDIAYLTTSAYDSNMLPKIIYENHIYNKGEEALKAHNNLYVHPSGSVYNKSLIDLDELDNFLDYINATKYNFTVHSLIRMKLALQGAFVTLKKFTWIYSDTVESEDVAVNSAKKKISVYDTEFEIERYRTEAFWCNKVLNDSNVKIKEYLKLMEFYLFASTWNNKLIYNDKRMRSHYNFNKKKIDCKKERIKFLKSAKQIEEELNIVGDEEYNKGKKKIIKKNKFLEPFLYFIRLLKIKIPEKKLIKKVIFTLFPFLRKNK